MVVSGAGEDVCLTYANTRMWRGRAAPVETLANVADLLGWAGKVIGLDPDAVEELAGWSRRHAPDAAELFADAIALREAIYRIFSAVANGDPAGDDDLAVLNGALTAAPPRGRLERLGSSYGWRIEAMWTARGGISAPALLAPVLWSAADLLIRSERRRVRRCANDQCLWLFLDASKNGTRRWCDMAACGNRAKARRHYLKRTRG